MRYYALFLAGVFTVLCLAACQKQPEDNRDTQNGDSNSALENGLNDSLEDPLDQDLSTLVTVEELEEVFGTAMIGPEMMDHDTVASYQNESGSLIVELLAEKTSRAEFDVMIEGIASDLVDAPNLGEISYWVPEYKTIYTFSGKHMASVTIYADTIAQNDALIFSRQVIVKMLKHLEE